MNPVGKIRKAEIQELLKLDDIASESWHQWLKQCYERAKEDRYLIELARQGEINYRLHNFDVHVDNIDEINLGGLDG